MPITFIVNGFFLIFTLFGLVKFTKNYFSIFFTVVSLLIAIGFIRGNMFIGNVSYNVFFAAAVIMIFLFLLSNKMFLLSGLLVSCVNSVFYYLLVTNDYVFLLTYGNSEILKLFLVLFSCVVSSGINSVVTTFLSSIVIVFISGFVSCDNFFIFDFDFLFCIETAILSILILFFLKMFERYLIIKFRKSVYVKEDFSFDSSCIFCFNNISQ